LPSPCQTNWNFYFAYNEIMFNSLFQLFNVKAITDNVLQISENYYDSWNKANMYLFRENGESILVDTGTGVFDPVKFLLEHRFINKKPKVNKYLS
jgi:hypothetical protein